MRCCMTSFAILLALIVFSPTQTIAKGPDVGGHGDSKGGGQSGSNQAGGEQRSDHQAKVGGGEQSGDHQAKVGGSNAGTNLGVQSNTGGSGGHAMKPHQVYDARNKPEFSGGNGEGRDSWRYRWDNDRWWFWGADNRWTWYGDDGQWQPYGNAYVVQRPIVEGFSGGPIKIVNPAKNGVTLNYTLDGNAFTIPPGYSQDLREDRAWVIEFSRGPNLDQTQYGLKSGVYTFSRTDHGLELHRGEFQQTAATKPPKEAPQAPKPAQTNPSPK